MSKKEWKKQFGYRISQYMKDRGLTQTELGFKTDISQGSIAKYVSGSTIPNAYHISKLAKAFGCSSSDLIDF